MACIINIPTIVNYTSSIINKIEALLTDNPRVIIHHVFIVQATGNTKGGSIISGSCKFWSCLKL